jgi:hypothetical protein
MSEKSLDIPTIAEAFGNLTEVYEYIVSAINALEAERDTLKERLDVVANVSYEHLTACEELEARIAKAQAVHKVAELDDKDRAFNEGRALVLDALKSND